MRRKHETDEELEELIEEILVDAYGEEEQMAAFECALGDNLELPAAGMVVGVPVTVVAIGSSGSGRRGVLATCRRPDGSEHQVDILSVVFPEDFSGRAYLSAYRRWLGE